MAVHIRKARRSATKLRLLLEGPAGSGKTFGALKVSTGLGGKIVVIDSENGSSDRYDGLFSFDVIDLKPPFTPESYIEAIAAAEDAGFDIIVIDSIAHEWNGAGGCLELVDKLAAAKYRGNTWSAYSEITPRHRAFIEAMLRSRCHLIATARSKTETAQVEEGGRKKVVKLGMKAETRDGAEYEFDLVFDIVHDGHFATVSKDRTNIFGSDPHVLSEETGRRLAEWLAGATPIEPAPAREETRKASKPRADHGEPATASGKQPTATKQSPEEKLSAARTAINGAGTLKQLDAIVARIEERVASGDFTAANREELIGLAEGKAELLELDQARGDAYELTGPGPGKD